MRWLKWRQMLRGGVKGAVIGMIHVQALPGKAFESQESTHCMDTKSCLYSSDACIPCMHVSLIDDPLPNLPPRVHVG